MSGPASFLNNTAVQGGALVVRENSTVFWSAQTFFINNAAKQHGGNARIYGNSMVSWSGETYFINNSAIAGAGGAFSLTDTSSVNWAGKSLFLNNSASRYGGALYLRSSVSWSEETSFINSTAGGSGGAFYARDCSISWSAETYFNSNIATSMGMLSLLSKAPMHHGKHPHFFDNRTSSYFGGAVLIYANSTMSWGATTSFVNNTAGSSGGGLVSLVGSTVTMQGDTLFFSNFAGLDGGVTYIYRGDGQDQSYLTILSWTVFLHNKCVGNGGGMVLFGSVSTELEKANMTFSGNIAGVAGVALYVSGAVFGPKFVRTTFVSNSAAMGGGVYITGSGIAIGVIDDTA